MSLAKIGGVGRTKLMASYWRAAGACPATAPGPASNADTLAPQMQNTRPGDSIDTFCERWTICAVLASRPAGHCSKRFGVCPGYRGAPGRATAADTIRL